MEITSVDKDNLQKSNELYTRLKSKLEDFYIINQKARKKVDKLKLLGQYQNYVINTLGGYKLINNMTEDMQWNGYEVIYVPEEVTYINFELFQRFNSDSILITGDGTLDILDMNGVKSSITRIIVACRLKPGCELCATFMSHGRLDDCILYGTVYDKHHQLTPCHAIHDMTNTFLDCVNIRRLVMLGFNYTRLKFLTYTFKNCINLKRIFLENIDKDKPTLADMSGCFQSCKNIINLDLSMFDTRNVLDLSSLFSDCIRLTTINGLDKFIIKPITRLDKMFSGCISLQRLDIKSWDVLDKPHFKMFENCPNIKTTGSIKLDLKLGLGRNRLASLIGRN